MGDPTFVANVHSRHIERTFNVGGQSVTAWWDGERFGIIEQRQLPHVLAAACDAMRAAIKTHQDEAARALRLVRGEVGT